jgi:hypothetical protein
MLYQLRNQKPVIWTHAAEGLLAAVYNTGNLAIILRRYDIQNLTFLNQIKSLYKLKSSAPMALQFLYHDTHAYFNRTHGKKKVAVFYSAPSILILGWLVNG